MTPNEAITKVIELKPGYEYTASSSQLLDWLNECEGNIYHSLIENYFDQDTPALPVYSFMPTEGDGTLSMNTKMIVPEPYSNLYVHYLAAMMCYWNRENTGYVNAKEQYQNLLNQYMAEYMKTHWHKPMPFIHGRRF